MIVYVNIIGVKMNKSRAVKGEMQEGIYNMRDHVQQLTGVEMRLKEFLLCDNTAILGWRARTT